MGICSTQQAFKGDFWVVNFQLIIDTKQIFLVDWASVLGEVLLWRLSMQKLVHFADLNDCAWVYNGRSPT